MVAARIRQTLLGCCAATLVTGWALPLHAQQPADATDPKQEAPAADAPRVDAELTPPKLIKDAKPVYPKRAQDEGVAAVVVLDIDIDATGKVEKAVVTGPAEAEGYEFDEAALEAAKKLVFEPARAGDQPIPVRISYRITFVPDVGPETEDEKPQPDEREPEAETAAPTGELRGTLNERGTRLPLAGVTVTVFRGEGDEAEGYETDTDEEGNFRFEGLGVGKWRLLADPTGYYPLRTTEEVTAGTRTSVEYRIERRSYNPYDVVVETDRVRREVSRTSIDARQAERIPGTFGDVLEVVRNFPGVARGGFGEFVVRGSSPEDSRFFVSGIDVPLIYHFIGIRSVLPVGMVESVDFYPGNYSVEFGRATGGIIDVQYRDLSPKKIGGYADVSILDGSLYLEAPITDELSVAVAGRRSWLDALLEPLESEFSGVGRLVLPRYYDAQALVSYRPDPAHQIQTFFFASDDRFEVVFDEPEVQDPDFVVSDIGLSTTFYRVLTEYQYVPNERFGNELKVSFGHDLEDFNVGQLIYWNLSTYSAQVRDTARYALSDVFAIRGGIDYLMRRRRGDVHLPPLVGQEGQASGRPEPDDAVSSSFESTLHFPAVFAELEFHPFEGTLILPGVRCDYSTRTESLAISPRLTARQGLSDQWTVKGGVGLFVQDPEPNETDEGLGNPDLEPEQAMHYSVGVEYRPWEHVLFDVTGFYKTLSNLVSPTDAVTERNGETVPLRFSNEGEGRVIGMEVSIRHELANNFFGWLAYTLSRAERRDAGSHTYRLFDYDQTHILTVIGAYRLPRNWEISSRWRYVTGNLYTPMVGSVYDADEDEYAPIPGEVNSDRVDAFHQLDIRIDKRWVYDSWILSAYLDVQNVYSRSNPETVSHNFDYSEQEIDSGLPILPVLGLRGEF
jgi:TonB family protein